MNFASLGLIEPLTLAVKEQGYHTPSPIQSQAIPPILAGKDILACAQTGTGKTASFLLPILQTTHAKGRAKPNRTKVLILTPTRELAAQIYESIQQYGIHLALRSAVVFGGVKINPQMMRLRSGVELLVATPGRLLDLHQQRAIQFDELETLVLDEADRMLDLGFIHDIKRIIKLLPYKRQNLLFSATFSNEIRSLVKGILHEPVEIDLAPKQVTAVAVKQIIHPVDKGRKNELLSHLIHKNKWGQTLVFTRTKHGANKLVKQLEDSQIHAIAIHGNKSQSQRTKALAKFKSGELHILVATDIAARGIDIDLLPRVVNFDLPDVAEDYVHRIGRTGRAGSSGLAISLVCADEIHQLQSIEKLIKNKIPRKEIEDFEPQHQLPSEVITRPTKNINAARNKRSTQRSNNRTHKTANPRAKRRVRS